MMHIHTAHLDQHAAQSLTSAGSSPSSDALQPPGTPPEELLQEIEGLVGASLSCLTVPPPSAPEYTARNTKLGAAIRTKEVNLPQSAHSPISLKTIFTPSSRDFFSATPAEIATQVLENGKPVSEKEKIVVSAPGQKCFGDKVLRNWFLGAIPLSEERIVARVVRHIEEQIDSVAAHHQLATGTCLTTPARDHMTLAFIKALVESINLESLQPAYECHLGRRLSTTITMSDVDSEPVDENPDDFSVRESREAEASEEPEGHTHNQEDHLAGDDRSEVDYEPSESLDPNKDPGEGSGLNLLR